MSSKLPKLVNEKYGLSIAGTSAMGQLRSAGVQMPAAVEVSWQLEGAAMPRSLRSKASVCPQVNAKCKLIGITQVPIHGLVLRQAVLDTQASPPTLQLDLVHPTAELVAQLAPPSVSSAFPEHLRDAPPDQVLQWLQPLLRPANRQSQPSQPGQQPQSAQQPSQPGAKGKYVNRNLWVPKDLVERVLTAEQMALGQPCPVPLHAVADGVYLRTSNERPQLQRDTSGGWVIRLTRKDHVAILGKEKVAWHALPRSSPQLLQWQVPSPAEGEEDEELGLVLELSHPAPATPAATLGEGSSQQQPPPSPERTVTAPREEEAAAEEADTQLEPCRLFEDEPPSPSRSMGSTDTWSTDGSEGSESSGEDEGDSVQDLAALRLLTVQQLQQQVRERREQLVQSLESLARVHQQHASARRAYDDLLEERLDMDVALAAAMDPADERRALYEQLEDLDADARDARGQERSMKRRLADTQWKLKDLRTAISGLSAEDVDRAVEAAQARRRYRAEVAERSKGMCSETKRRRKLPP